MLQIELFVTYEVRTLLKLTVFRCWTRVLSDNDTTPTYNYTELYDFFQIISNVGLLVSVSCQMFVSVSVLHSL
jgi:hypothetical protein